MRLYQYQIDAIDRMHNGCILCGGVGSGKSITALGYYYLVNGGEIGTLLGEEYVPMDDPPLDLYIITMAHKRDTFEWQKELSPFLLSTSNNLYCSKVVIDSWNNIAKYSDVTNAFFIFDEQRVVGSGVWVKSFLKIAKNNRWILLSATPGDNWMEYAPVFIANGFFKNRTQFIQEHVMYMRNSKYPRIERYLGESQLERMRDKVLVDMDFSRPTMSHHIDIYLDFDSAQYKDIMRRRWDIWKNEPITDASGLCYALRKSVNSDPSRQQTLLELAHSHSRMIIFYSFDYELEILKKIPWPSDTVVAEWNGHKHEEVPDSRRWVYLVNYAAGAEGWNCIATNTVVFYSQHYSYKVMVQASGRIDRVNTPYKDLYYYHLKSRSGIDLAIGRALREKRTFNETRFCKNHQIKKP